MGNRYSNPYDPYWYDYDPMYGGMGGYYDYDLSAWRPRSRGLFGSRYGYYYSPYDYYYPTAVTPYPYYSNYYQPTMMQPYYYPRMPYF